MTMINHGVMVLASQSPAANLNTNGNTADLVVGTFVELAIDATVAAIVGGTSPTITFIVERKGQDGLYYPIKTATAIPAAGGTLSLSIGSGLSTAESFGSIARLRWTVAGAPTTVNTTYTITGKS